MAGETSTYQSYLMHHNGTSWVKLADIKDYPDLAGDPNMLEVTTQSDPAERQIAGIKQAVSSPFTLNYVKEEYASLKELEGKEQHIAVWFGGSPTGEPTGSDGIFEGVGIPSLKPTGKGVNDVRETVITFAMVEPFEFKETPSEVSPTPAG